MRMLTRRLVVLGVCVLAVVFAGAASAQSEQQMADDASLVREGPIPVTGPATSQLQPDGGGVDNAPSRLASGCYGQTDRPHPSSHYPGSVNVEARTVCFGRSVYVSTALYRDRWYGPQFLDSGSNSGYGSVETNASWWCSGTGTYTYRAYSYHSATGAGTANTYNYARFTC